MELVMSNNSATRLVPAAVGMRLAPAARLVPAPVGMRLTPAA
jgi:hypothetical protein